MKQKQLTQYIKKIFEWTLRLVIALFVFNQLMPGASRAYLNEPRTVDTLKSNVCVHTRVIDEVHEWKIQKTFDLVREMGADTVVEFFPWAYIEQEQGQYNWGQADKIMLHAQNQGLQVIARMGFVPDWAKPDIENDYTTLNYLPDESFDEFADFVVTFATRYTGTVNHIIIWNEPNLAFEWGYRDVDPTGYVELLKAVYEPVKNANPDVMILAGALAPTIEPRGSTNGLNDLFYLEDMYKAGGADYFDALAIHTYGFTQAPEVAPDPN